jgi:hypothetical protein
MTQIGITSSKKNIKQILQKHDLLQHKLKQIKTETQFYNDLLKSSSAYYLTIYQTLINK